MTTIIHVIDFKNLCNQFLKILLNFKVAVSSQKDEPFEVAFLGILDLQVEYSSKF